MISIICVANFFKTYFLREDFIKKYDINFEREKILTFSIIRSDSSWIRTWIRYKIDWIHKAEYCHYNLYSENVQTLFGGLISCTYYTIISYVFHILLVILLPIIIVVVVMNK